MKQVGVLGEVFHVCCLHCSRPWPGQFAQALLWSLACVQEKASAKLRGLLRRCRKHSFGTKRLHGCCTSQHRADRAHEGWIWNRALSPDLAIEVWRSLPAAEIASATASKEAEAGSRPRPDPGCRSLVLSLTSRTRKLACQISARNARTTRGSSTKAFLKCKIAAYHEARFQRPEPLSRCQSGPPGLPTLRSSS